jgi:hypothetical protein
MLKFWTEGQNIFLASMTKRKLLLVKVCVSINDWYIEWLLYSIENKSTLIKQPIVMYYLYTLNWSLFFPNITNHIGGIMVSLLASSVVEHGFEPPSGQTKDYEIDICCFSAKHAALKRKSKDWLARNHDSVSKWGDMSICKTVVSVRLWCLTSLSNFFQLYRGGCFSELAL